MRRASSRQELSRKVKENQQQALEKIIFAHELERRKWALEVHDGITQSLANIYYRLQACRKLLSKDPVKAQRDLDEIENLVTEAIAEARGVIDGLRPSILDDVGLIPAIEKHLKRVREKDNLAVSFEVPNPIPSLSWEVETAVYRIIQEALHNVSKHAKATEIKLEIASQGNQLVAEVTDNGQGFDLEAADIDGDNWGLTGMRERAEVIGSCLKIESSLGQGTSVRLEVPLHLHAR